MAEQKPEFAEMSGWVQAMQDRVQRVLDSAEQMTPQAQFDELTEMAEQFFQISRSFLDLGKLAANAARNMLPQLGGRDLP